jgi:hypothetical protein
LALQTAWGSFTVNLPILDVFNASSLRNVAGSLFVSRCVQADFSAFVDSSAIQLSVCSVGLRNIFPAKKAVVCVQCQPGYFKSVMSTGACVVCPVGQTSNAEASNCFGGACADVVVPDYGCVNAAVVVTANPGNGSWTSSNASVVTFADNNSGSTSFSSALAGAVEITWIAASKNCSVSKNVSIIGPVVAAIPLPTGSLCGSAGGPVNIGANLIGGATNGNRTSNFGAYKNSKSAFTVFTWSQSGTVQFEFAPNSACRTPATLSFDIAAQCPSPPLSREATIGVAVGATLGGLG